MPSRAIGFLFAAVVCVTATPLAAQDQQAVPTAPPAALQAQATEPTRNTAGPRLQPAFKSYEPAIARDSRSMTTAASAGKTTITITTLGLVLLIVLLVLLIA